MRVYILLCITGLVVWLPATVTSGHIVNRRWANRHVDYIDTGNPDTGRSLHDALADPVDQTYTDFEQRLTSIKDSGLNACFIFDLDPNLDLQKEDKNNIMRSQEPRSIENDLDFRQFTNRVGPYIANMCKRSKVFWLVSESTRDDVHDTAPKPDNGRARHIIIQPPRLRTAAIPRSHPRAPPRPASRHRSPPHPPSIAHRSNRIAAPPPVSEYKAQRVGHSAPAAPPPPPPASNSNRAAFRPDRIRVSKTVPEAPQLSKIRAPFRAPPPPPHRN